MILEYHLHQNEQFDLEIEAQIYLKHLFHHLCQENNDFHLDLYQQNHKLLD